MKEYVVTINDKPYNVVIKKLQTDTAVVEVDGEEYEVGVERKLTRHLEPLDVKPVRKSPVVSETVAMPAAPTASANDIVSPLPGLILTILVKPGDAVKPGQTVLKMEAMKMENEIKASRAGTVKEIYVKEGDAVLENAPLVKIGE